MTQNITVNNVSRQYLQGQEQVNALGGVTLKFLPGEFTTLFGPSGSGKTTLLNIIGGLDIPSSGSVFIGDTEISSLSNSERARFRLHHIGFVFQSYNLIPVLTARENVEFVMQLQGVSKKSRKNTSMEILKQVGIEQLSDRRPEEMSGGQQQRVAVARALASKPDIVLADEPTANLDSKSAASLLSLMQNLNTENNLTFLFSTHDPRVLERAKRQIQLQDGKVISDKAT